MEKTKLIPTIINGKIHRLSEKALELLGLDRVSPQERPIALQKLPPNLEILKIQKKEPIAVQATETITKQPIEVVKKNEDAEIAVNTNTKKTSRGKVGVKK